MWPGFDRCSTRLANSSQNDTLADVEHISTIAGSLGSIGTVSQVKIYYTSINFLNCNIPPFDSVLMNLSTIQIIQI